MQANFDQRLPHPIQPVMGLVPLRCSMKSRKSRAEIGNMSQVRMKKFVSYLHQSISQTFAKKRPPNSGSFFAENQNKLYEDLPSKG